MSYQGCIRVRTWWGIVTSNKGKWSLDILKIPFSEYTPKETVVTNSTYVQYSWRWEWGGNQYWMGLVFCYSRRTPQHKVHPILQNTGFNGRGKHLAFAAQLTVTPVNFKESFSSVRSLLTKVLPLQLYPLAIWWKYKLLSFITECTFITMQHSSSACNYLKTTCLKTPVTSVVFHMHIQQQNHGLN